MKIGLSLLIALFLLVQPSCAASKTPETVVREFYSWYLKYFNGRNGSVLIVKEFPRFKNHLTSELYTQLFRAESPAKQEDALDWCPLVGGNCGWDSFTLGKTKVTGQQARVIVHVVGNILKWDVTVHLKHVGESWRIADVDLRDKVSLLESITPAKPVGPEGNNRFGSPFPNHLGTRY